jgi:predicted transcriptional regulator
MDTKDVLKELGLSEGESRVYLALLKIGETTVSELTKDTGQHRTTIYDFLEHLLQKGLASYVIRSGVKYYKVAQPEKLEEYLKEKEEKLKQIMPELKKLADFSRGEISVEVYQGVEGFKSVLNDRLRVGGDFLGFGVDESEFEKKLPIVMAQFLKKEREMGLKEYMLTKESAGFVYPDGHMHYRYIPDDYFEPTATAIYGDNVLMIIMEPFTSILIRNKGLAESYRKHFKMLWGLAKEKNPLSN